VLRNKDIFQISTLVCLSSISMCNLLIDLPSYKKRCMHGTCADSRLFWFLFFVTWLRESEILTRPTYLWTL
jgi:hypothetical protein